MTNISSVLPMSEHVSATALQCVVALLCLPWLLLSVRSGFMTHDDDESGELPDLSNREMFRMIMQEIADTNHELSGKIDGLSKRIDGLGEKISKVGSELHTLRLEVHQNQSAFMTNHAGLDKRVTTLEVAVFQ